MDEANTKEMNSFEISGLGSVRDHSFNIEDSKSSMQRLKNDDTIIVSQEEYNKRITNKLIYNQLVEEKKDNIIEVSDYGSNPSSYSSNQYGSTLSVRPLIDKVHVKTDFPIDEYHTENFSYVKCIRITTMTVDSRKFSFLNLDTIDTDLDDYLFIKNKKCKFIIPNKKTYEKKYKRRTKIPYEKLGTFINEVNSAIKLVSKEHNNVVSFSSKKKYLEIILITLICALITTLMYYFGKDIFGDNYYITYVIIVSLLIVFFFGRLFYLMSDYSQMYPAYKILLTNQKLVDDIVKKWNRECFHKEGIKAIAPTSFPYIQLSLVQGKRLSMDHH